MMRRLTGLVMALTMCLSLVSVVSVPAGAADDYPNEYKNLALDATADRWGFYNRECTSFVAWCMESRNGVTFRNQYVIVNGTRTNVVNNTDKNDNNGNGTRLGNAKYWGTAFRSMGFAVNSTPAVGAIAWYNGGSNGHVAWVSAVNGSNVTVEEYNWNTSNRGTYGTRTVAASTFTGFIHVKDGVSAGVGAHPIIGKGYTTSGAAVTNLQTMLNKVNNAGLDTDGIFGTKTESAVKAYQTKKGLTADGIVGEKTWAALEADYQAATAPAPAASSRPRVGYGFTTKGDDVKDMQTMLNAVNNAGLVVDGIFGDASLNALKAYQAKKGLEADGICGVNTWTALEADYKNAAQTAPAEPDPVVTPEPVTEPDPIVPPEPVVEPDPVIDPDPTPVDPDPTAIPEVHFPRQTVYHQGQFTDVSANQWFTDNVAEAFAFSLMKGNSAATFNPYGNVTVAEAVTMAARIHSIYTTGSESFVQTGSKWYQVYLDYAYQNGVISYAYYNSDVTQKATRAQYAEIFANALPGDGLYPINTVGDNAVPDVPMTASCAPSVYKLYRAGILTGSDVRGTFSPSSYITRAESAAIVSRMAESNNRVAFTLN